MFFCPDGNIPENIAPCETSESDCDNNNKNKNDIETTTETQATADFMPSLPKFPIFDNAGTSVNVYCKQTCDEWTQTSDLDEEDGENEEFLPSKEPFEVPTEPMVRHME